jgi:hypothetical protein
MTGMQKGASGTMTDELDVTPKSVLLAGKSPLVLKTTVDMLGERGYDAKSTDTFDDIAARFDVTRFDLVVFGGQVPQDKKAEMKHVISGLRRDVTFVQGLAGIPGLLVHQIEGAFGAQWRNGAHAPSYNANNRTIDLLVDRPAMVTVTAWWQTSFVPPDPLSDSQVLVSERLPAGEHTVTLPSEVPDKASFASVQIDRAIYTFGLTAPDQATPPSQRLLRASS